MREELAEKTVAVVEEGSESSGTVTSGTEIQTVDADSKDPSDTATQAESDSNSTVQVVTAGS